MACEMCSTQDSSFRVEIEGSRLNVCEKCSRFGKFLGKNVAAPKRELKKAASVPELKKTETVQIIKSDYYRLVKAGREKLGLTQEDFAKKLMEKESVLHKVESGHLKPDITLARKLEKFLKITLVEQVEVESSTSTQEKKKSDGFTIGDILSVK